MLPPASVAPGPRDPELSLETRLRQFETRLFRALLLVRAVLPTATLVVLLAAAAGGDAPYRATVVWAVLAVWTSATTAPLWSRLDWARGLPLPVRAEIGAFVLLVFLGLGTRPWHLLHAFVPLVFVCLFVGALEGVVVGALIVAALWSVYVVFALWGAAPIDPTLAATVPTVIVIGSALLVGYVRRLLGDVESIVADRRAAVAAIQAARARLAVDEAAADVYRRVSDRLRPISDRVRVAQEAVFGIDGPDRPGRVAALRDCLDALFASLDELVRDDAGFIPPPGTSTPPTLLSEIERAIAASAALGGTVRVEADAAGALPVRKDELRPVRRLLREAIVNARKHGTGSIVVRVPEHGGRVVEVENATRGVIAERAGGLGLHAIRGDATAIGAAIDLVSGNGVARVTVRLPPITATVGHREDVGDALRSAVVRRRDAYTTALLALRLTAAALTAATIQLEATKHRSLLPALTVTSALLVAWNALLLLGHRRAALTGSSASRLATFDGLLIAALILAEGGMASPWFALSIGSLVLLGFVEGARAAASFGAVFSLSMLGGYALVRVLGLDDLGTAQQDMPFGWILNAFIYAGAVALVAAIRWAFDRLDEAIAEHRRLVDERTAIERAAGRAEANNHVRRELHASIQQYVHAALVNLGTLEAGSDDALRALEEGLAELRDRLTEVFVELQQRPSTVNESASVA